MKISEVILERTKHDHALDAYVKSSVAKIAGHISSNTMVFFPEYTDHDISHFEAVLETAIDLATDKSLELLSDVDLAVLTTAVMLHDLGMHLTKDGFQTLIDPNGPLKPINGFGDQPWHKLWLSFLSEARRFDARKLEELFGSNYRPVTSFPSFEEPWDEFDLLLVGEFLRRHHPRLAHEIALQGMPSKNGSVVHFCSTNSDQEKFLSDISGLVARSHGMGLRQTFSYLESNYNNRIETRSSHPIYLMTLLRVADYLQIQSARAPTARTDVSKFKSPVSTREWSVHQCVTDITNIADPEAIDITAHPRSIETFLRLENWLVDLQRELDMSWAVLGEVYGLQTHSGLNKLGLRIRRLRSNIDATNEFSKTVDYIPEQIAFTAAGSDLLKLLVGPLYANDISVGLRELIQNATDAVKELDSLVDQGAINPPQARSDMSTDVQVDFVLDHKKSDDFNKSVKEIIVTDRGVGMTSEVLRHYFLKAGASFRNSTAWKESFEKDDGSTRVQRSGRFGVGALAAFLLGDEISVETRHYSEPDFNGLKFSAGIETSSINVIRTNCDVGTKIKILVPSHLRRKVGKLLPYSFSFEVDREHGVGQYFGRYPELTYTQDSVKIPWDNKCLLPASREQFEDPWNYFEVDNFEVNWTYASGTVGLAVNQIRVPGGNDRNSGYRSGSAGVRLNSKLFGEPSLSIGDNSGSFELNLQRSTYAAADLPFTEELLREVTDECIFSCLRQLANQKQLEFPKYSGFQQRYYRSTEPRWLRCSDGVLLNEVHFIKSYDPKFAFVRYGGHEDREYFENFVGALPNRSIFFHDANDEFTSRNFNMKGKLTRTLKGETLRFIQNATISRSTFVPTCFVELVRSKMKPGKEAQKFLNRLQVDDVADWLVQSDGEIAEPLKIKNWRETLDKDGSSTSVVSLHKLSNSFHNEKENNDTHIFDRWIELIGQPFLPTSASELSRLQDKLAQKIGSKYEIFERRAAEAELRKKERVAKLGPSENPQD